MNREARSIRDDKILSSYKGGKMPEKIAIEQKLGYARVVQILSDHKVLVNRNFENTKIEKQIMRDYKLGMKESNLEKLFEKWGKSKAYYILNKNGIKPGKVLTDKRNKNIATDFKSGIPPKEIAKKYNVNQSYVYEILGKKGLKTFPTPEEIKKRNEKVRKLYATKKYTQEKLAEKFGLSRGCIGLIVTNAHPYNN